ncbi:GNAT family N-acetyltransferase [Oerskovia paurometabola]|uniref:GNAT family N-acetyltransferase n=1 Tax=Oerskovia paurometabola TaxID=162170 RepID=A0ABW1XC28_9CELL|nr:GNAT family N-acetyltransferase [Oerskovia paurometabola]MBM7498796.1 ribosomal protein S18 acetylase RimI-like enzyme [Oerskovia paurometabola]
MPPADRPLRTDLAVTWRVAEHPVRAPESQAILFRYYTEVSDRFFGHATPQEDLVSGFAAQDSSGLAAPGGSFHLAWADGREGPVAVGCAGVVLARDASAPTAELKRVFVDPAFRGRGIATALLDAAESAARDLGAEVVRLDTRHDLVEALALYAGRGYVDVPAFNDDRYAQRWLALRL